MDDSDLITLRAELDVDVHYHKRRARFFDTTDRLLRVATLLTSTAAMVAIFRDSPREWAELWAALIAAAQTIGLVFQPAERARLHDGLARSFLAIEADLDDAEECPESARGIRAEKRRIEQDEPHRLRNLVWLAYNEYVLRRFGSDAKPEHLAHLSPWQRATAHLWDWRPGAVKTPQRYIEISTK